ncbi:MAG: hypothetical protein KAH57_07365, partial [Thermoplasmata archaeon]|nr:hypothetical protein [Thermoplasmata archaeon]
MRMRKRNLAGPLMVALLGLIGIIISISRGMIEVLLVLIVPVIVGKGLWAFVSIALFITGVVWLSIVYYGSKYDPDLTNTNSANTKGAKDQKKLAGGIVFMWPIPIVFGELETRTWFTPWGIILLTAFFFVSLIGLAIYLSLLFFIIGITL